MRPSVFANSAAALLRSAAMAPSSVVRSPREARLRELDGWRAISVLLGDCPPLSPIPACRPSRTHVRLARVLHDCGPLGVKVFFVVSGFVICRLLILEEKRNGAVSLKGFYIRRVFRILPPFYLYLACLGVLVALGWIGQIWQQIFSSAIFLYDVVPVRADGWFIGHTWSLAVEEQFYIVFPMLWVLTRKVGRERVFSALFLLIVMWNISAAFLDWNRAAPREGFACISFGVLLAIFEARARAIVRHIPSLVAFIVAICLLWHPEDQSGWKSDLYESIFMPPAIALVLVSSLEKGELLRRFLCSWPMQAIGLTSYGVYLWQQLFTAPSRFYNGSGRQNERLLPLLLVIIPISYFFIERPSMRLGRRLAERYRKESSPVRRNIRVFRDL